MEENLKLTLVRLQERLLLDDAGITKLVTEHQSFLGLSLESHRERMAWLQTRILQYLASKHEYEATYSYMFISASPHVVVGTALQNLEQEINDVVKSIYVCLDDQLFSVGCKPGYC
jgi:hypothetical protein